MTDFNLDLNLTETEPTTKRKQFSVYLDQETFQNFIRIFPGQGDRQIFVRATIREVIRQVNKDPNSMSLPDAVKFALELPSLKIRMKEGG